MLSQARREKLQIGFMKKILFGQFTHRPKHEIYIFID